MDDPSGRPDRKAGTPDICIVLNAGSGKDKTDAPAEIEAAMRRHPGRFVLRVIAKGQNLPAEIERAADEGFTTLVAAGGDGTIGAVASVVRARDLTLGIVPLGTFNFFARSLDLPETIPEAIDLIATGSARPVSPGDINGEMFLNNASLGVYPAILAEREGTYRRWGRSRVAAYWSVVTTFLRFRGPLTLDVTVDGESFRRRSPLAFVARSDYQLDWFGLDGAEEVRAGKFAMFLAPDVSRWRLLVFALRLAGHSMKAGRDFDLFSGREIDIETRVKRRLVARDGEREKMRTPFRFRILDDALRVIAPPAADEPVSGRPVAEETIDKSVDAGSADEPAAAPDTKPNATPTESP